MPFKKRRWATTFFFVGAVKANSVRLDLYSFVSWNARIQLRGSPT
jgi:hypothetical protein